MLNMFDGRIIEPITFKTSLIEETPNRVENRAHVEFKRSSITRELTDPIYWLSIVGLRLNLCLGVLYELLGDGCE
jgi:hypothetical protein